MKTKNEGPSLLDQSPPPTPPPRTPGRDLCFPKNWPAKPNLQAKKEVTPAKAGIRIGGKIVPITKKGNITKALELKSENQKSKENVPSPTNLKRKNQEGDKKMVKQENEERVPMKKVAKVENQGEQFSKVSKTFFLFSISTLVVLINVLHAYLFVGKISIHHALIGK